LVGCKTKSLSGMNFYFDIIPHRQSLKKYIKYVHKLSVYNLLQKYAKIWLWNIIYNLHQLLMKISELYKVKSLAWSCCSAANKPLFVMSGLCL